MLMKNIKKKNAMTRVIADLEDVSFDPLTVLIVEIILPVEDAIVAKNAF